MQFQKMNHNSSGSYINTYIDSEKYQEERITKWLNWLGIPASNLSFDIEKNADKVSDNTLSRNFRYQFK